MFILLLRPAGLGDWRAPRGVHLHMVPDVSAAGGPGETYLHTQVPLPFPWGGALPGGLGAGERGVV